MKIDYAAWAVMFIALAGLFRNVNTGFSRVHERIHRMQAETNARFDAHQAGANRRFEAVNARLDAHQAETSRRFDEMQAEMNRMRTEMNRRFDTLQAENQRRHDAMEEALRVFEGRITRLEENAGIGPEGAE